MDGLASDAFAFHICVLHFLIYKRFAAADYNSFLGRDLRPFLSLCLRYFENSAIFNRKPFKILSAINVFEE